MRVSRGAKKELYRVIANHASYDIHIKRAEKILLELPSTWSSGASQGRIESITLARRNKRIMMGGARFIVTIAGADHMRWLVYTVPNTHPLSPLEILAEIGDA